MFACIGDGEAKNGDFEGKMVKLEKVRYGSKTQCQNSGKSTNTGLSELLYCVRNDGEKSSL